MKKSFCVVCIYLWIVCSPAIYAQKQKVDSTRIYKIPEVTVTEQFRTREVRATAPTQVLSADKLKKLNVLQVSDAVKHLVGVTVKDYGGIGGMKTVSLRSLGANHTAVGYDGITISDCQSGQIDLSRFSLDNVDRISLSNGQSDNIFQPARFFASSGTLNIQTLSPVFKENARTNVRFSFKTGSWGLINPSIAIEQRLSKRWTASVNGEWMSADGHYPYSIHYGSAKEDSVSHHKRKNSQVQTLRTEAALFGNFSSTEQWKLKAYYYQSSRGLPDATVFYYSNPAQHLWDKSTFIQSQYKKEISPKVVFQTSAKWNWSYQHYLDPHTYNLAGKEDNSYYQQEYYLSASVLWRTFRNLSFSLSTDGAINTMRANLIDFPYPTRYSWLTVVAAKYVNEHITASASALFTLINEDTRTGDSGDNHRKLSPYVSFSYQPFIEHDLRIRAFYKHVFRLPTFNDLYYSQIGNTKLKPENTSQYNVGLTYSREICSWLPQVSATADFYYNRVTDKIIAKPTGNIFKWSMENLGIVDIRGVDATASISFQPWEKLKVDLTGNYTYQRALDITDSQSKTYRNQIAYTPRVSGSGQVGIETPWINLSYSLLHSGKRYTTGQNLTKNRLEGYSDHSLSAERSFSIKKKTSISLNAEVLNLLNKNYEIVNYFPMPGRSFRITLKLNY
ncbi:MAG: TonB-dependent receptor [Bacteroidaceae bacterium]